VDSTIGLLGQTVQVVSRAGINDPTAPCGGMEYAQHGKVALVR
jgi:hypothetical protein